MEEKIKVEQLNAWFGTHRALKNINLTILKSMVTAIIGPSGCGKSTFIRCINRMHEVVPGAKMEGRIWFGGEDIARLDMDPVQIRRRIGMVFQKPTPFPTLSIFDNVSVGLKLNGISGNIGEMVEKSLQQAALWDEVKDKLAQPGIGLSGGQQQRLCIARALAVNPEVILMDEPCSALDPISTAKIEELIQILKTNYTVLIVTHNMQQAARVSDRTGFFLLGELIEFDVTSKIFTNPLDKRTEDYITGRFG